MLGWMTPRKLALDAMFCSLIAIVSATNLPAQQTASAPQLSGALAPSTTLHPPMGEKILFRVHARGVQIYTCSTSDGGYAWTLKAPDAKLYDAGGHEAGTHSAGPTWTMSDGSSVKGKAVATRKSPYPDAVPWLLVLVQSHQGQGKLAAADYVQRTDTHGGAAPATGCDDSHAGTESSIPYSATYTFYGHKR